MSKRPFNDVTSSRLPQCPDSHPQGRLIDLTGQPWPSLPASPNLFDPTALAMLNTLITQNPSLLTLLSDQNAGVNLAQLLPLLGGLSASPNSLNLSYQSDLHHLNQESRSASSTAHSMPSPSTSQVPLLEVLLGRGYGHGEASKHIFNGAVLVNGQIINNPNALVDEKTALISLLPPPTQPSDGGGAEGRTETSIESILPPTANGESNKFIKVLCKKISVGPLPVTWRSVERLRALVSDFSEEEVTKIELQEYEEDGESKWTRKATNGDTATSKATFGVFHCKTRDISLRVKNLLEKKVEESGFEGVTLAWVPPVMAENVKFDDKDGFVLLPKSEAAKFGLAMRKVSPSTPHRAPAEASAPPPAHAFSMSAQIKSERPSAPPQSTVAHSQSSEILAPLLKPSIGVMGHSTGLTGSTVPPQNSATPLALLQSHLKKEIRAKIEALGFPVDEEMVQSLIDHPEQLHTFLESLKALNTLKTVDNAATTPTQAQQSPPQAPFVAVPPQPAPSVSAYSSGYPAQSAPKSESTELQVMKDLILKRLSDLTSGTPANSSATSSLYQPAQTLSDYPQQMHYDYNKVPSTFGMPPLGPPRSGKGSRPEDQDVKPGDWQCKQCGTNNFARRDKCFKCAVDRSLAMSDSPITSGSAQNPGGITPMHLLLSPNYKQPTTTPTTEASSSSSASRSTLTNTTSTTNTSFVSSGSLSTVLHGPQLPTGSQQPQAPKLNLEPPRTSQVNAVKKPPPPVKAKIPPPAVPQYGGFTPYSHAMPPTASLSTASSPSLFRPPSFAAPNAYAAWQTPYPGYPGGPVHPTAPNQPDYSKEWADYYARMGYSAPYSGTAATPAVSASPYATSTAPGATGYHGYYQAGSNAPLYPPKR